MAYPTAQRKRLLEHELTSTESKYKSVKRELIAALDSVKSERGSKNPSIRRQADAQYNDLLSKFHDQNQMFDELLLDLKSQIYNLEAQDLYGASHNSATELSCPPHVTHTQDHAAQSATITSPSSTKWLSQNQKTQEDPPSKPAKASNSRTKGYAGSLQVAKAIKTIEQSLVKSRTGGFSYLSSCPIIVREHAESGRRRNRWVQIHCAACGSTVKSNDDFFLGVTGLHNHLARSSCRETCDAQGLDPWDYMVLHCMQEVSEAYVVTVVSGQVDIPRVHAEVNTHEPKQSTETKETKEQALERIRISKLQSNNSFYNKPPPRKHVPTIIDLDGDAELPEQQSNCSVDQENTCHSHGAQQQNPSMTADLGSPSCESIERAATEPLIDMTEINAVAPSAHCIAAGELLTTTAGSSAATRQLVTSIPRITEQTVQQLQ